MTAAKLNEHLSNGGFVQVTTYLKSTVYTPKHVGWFFEKSDGLYVKYGKGSNYLGPIGKPYVGIRLSKLGE